MIQVSRYLLYCVTGPLQNFCKDWKLDINPNKIKVHVIVFCKKEITDNTFGFYTSGKKKLCITKKPIKDQYQNKIY